MSTVGIGVPGLEARHQWADVIDLNNPGAWPRYDLDRITGLHSLPEADDNRESAFGRIGEIVYPSLQRGKTVTYEGRVIGRNLAELRQGANALRGACPSGDEAPMRIQSPLPDTTQWLTYARCLSCDVDDDQAQYSPWAVPTAYQRNFVLALRLHDPRFYASLEAITTGGTNGAVVGVNNVGTAPANPVFVVNGPITDDLVFERAPGVDTHHQVLFDSVTLSAGQQLQLNWANRTLLRVSDGVDYTPKINFEQSNWWDAGEQGVPPGSHALRVAGGGDWTVTFWPASW